MHEKIRSVAKRGARVMLTASHRFLRNIYTPSKSRTLKSLRILTYHNVLPVPRNDWAVSVFHFIEQMHFLADHYALVSLDDIRAWMNGKRDIPENAVAVTFDDGLQGVYDYAFPVLDRYNIPATAFVLEEATKKGKIWSGELALTVEQIMTMAKHRFIVGSHGRSHVSLGASALSEHQLTGETEGSRKTLEDLLEMPVRYFAYPYGTKRDLNSRVISAVEDAGYQLAFTSIHGKNDFATDRFQLKRVKVERMDSLSTFAELLRGGMDQWSWIDNHATWLQSARRTR